MMVIRAGSALDTMVLITFLVCGAFLLGLLLYLAFLIAWALLLSALPNKSAQASFEEGAEMFEVMCSCKLDEEWEKREEMIDVIAGRHCDYFVAGSDGKNQGQSDHGWFVSTFDEALEMKEALQYVSGLNVTIREKISQPKKKRKK